MSTEQIIINIDTSKRALTYEGTLILGVKGDDCAQRIYFKCPKYINEFFDDLTSENIKIYIDYQNAHGEPYLQEASTISSVDDTTVMFSWLITNLATAKVGNVSFNVCIKKTVDGVLKHEWHTTNNLNGRILDKVDTSKKTPEVITHDSVTIENFTAEYSSFKAQVAALNENLTDAKQYIESEVEDEVTTKLETVVPEAVKNELSTVYVPIGEIFTTDLISYDNFIIHWTTDKYVLTDSKIYDTTIYWGIKAYSQANTLAKIVYTTSEETIIGYIQYTIKGTCISKDENGNKKYLIELIIGDYNSNKDEGGVTVPDSARNQVISVDGGNGLFFVSTDIPFGLTTGYLVAKKY